MEHDARAEPGMARFFRVCMILHHGNATTDETQQVAKFMHQYPSFDVMLVEGVPLAPARQVAEQAPQLFSKHDDQGLSAVRQSKNASTIQFAVACQIKHMDFGVTFVLPDARWRFITVGSMEGENLVGVCAMLIHRNLFTD